MNQTSNNSPEKQKSNDFRAYEEALIEDIEPKKDKNQNDYWILRTLLNSGRAKKSFVAFSRDYDLSAETKSLLTNYPEQIINKIVNLIVKRQPGPATSNSPYQETREKVVKIELKSPH